MDQENIAARLGITDDMMFQNVMKKPANCKGFLRAVLPELNIKSVKVKTQERIGREKAKGQKTSILDVWARDERGRLYDIEMQVADEKNLAKRARFYLHKLDEDALRCGEDYSQLRPAYVIFILPFDPEGRGYRDYRFRYYCQRDKSIELGDKSEIIFLNTRGHLGRINPDLQDFYDLVNGKETGEGALVTAIKKTMADIKTSPEWRQHEMNTAELVKEATEKATKETQIHYLKKTIRLLRMSDNNDEQILQKLTTVYGEDFSEVQLKQIIKETK